MINRLSPDEQLSYDAEPSTTKKKRYSQQQHQEWEQEAIRLAKTRRYKNKLDICRAIRKRLELEDKTTVSAEHICRAIKIPPTDLQTIITNS
jgi:hypothetical protein